MKENKTIDDYLNRNCKSAISYTRLFVMTIMVLIKRMNNKDLKQFLNEKFGENLELIDFGIEAFNKSDTINKNNELYSILIINNYCFLMVSTMENGYFYYKNSKIISYLGKDLEFDEIEAILNGIKLFI